jgi:uroporphyrinogen-III synthase
MDERGATASLRPPLTGWTVISLRPSGGHAALRRAAQRHGAQLLPMSPLALRPCPAETTLGPALAAARVVFTSPAAVRFAAVQAPLQARPEQIWLAVGAGTAAALRRHGITARYCAERMDSEGLLSLPALADLAQCEVGLITAPDGRELLADALRQRARRLLVAHVYRREPRRIGAAAWQRLRAQTGPVALAVSSSQALQALLEQCPPDLRTTLRGAVALVASARLEQAAQQAGFAARVRAASARPNALLSALAAYRPDSAFR